MEKNIEIPEGYEARIEGNKVILEKKESEDERIRKHIIKILDSLAPCHWDGNEKAKCIAYLERQKEQQPAEWSEEEKMHFANAILAAEKEWGVNSYTARFLETLRDNYKKCNSRWNPSEEQMAALLNAEGLVRANNYPENAKILTSLYEDLKKL